MDAFQGSRIASEVLLLGLSAVAASSTYNMIVRVREKITNTSMDFETSNSKVAKVV